MATFKSIIEKFRKDLNNAYRSRKSVLDVTDEYLKQLENAEFDGTGVTPEQMEAVTGDLDDLTTTSKTNLVSAINELRGKVFGIFGYDTITGTTDVTGNFAMNISITDNKIPVLSNCSGLYMATFFAYNGAIYVHVTDTSGVTVTNTEITFDYFYLSPQYSS